MARYFKVIEIEHEDFIKATGEDLGYYMQSTIPVNEDVFVVVDDEYESEFYVSLECFDKECANND